MAKDNSFNKATKSLKTAGFKEATKKLNVVNFAAEFQKRGIDVKNSEMVK